MATPPYDADAQDALLTGQMLTGQRCLAQFEPEALVAGLLEDPDGAASRLLQALAIDLAVARSAAEQALGQLPTLQYGTEVSIASTRLRNVLGLAEAEAARMGDGAVGAGHLLLGVLAAGDSTIARDLASIGATPDSLRRVLDGERRADRTGDDSGAPVAGAPDDAPVARSLDADLADEVDALLGELLRTTRAAVAIMAGDLEPGTVANANPTRSQAAVAWLDRAPEILERVARLRAAPRRR